MSNKNITQSPTVRDSFIHDLHVIDTGTKCATCGHDPYEEKTPFKTFILSIFTPSSLRLMANLLGGVSLWISNYHLLPTGVWDNPSTRLSVIMAITPSIALFVVLFASSFAAGKTSNSASLYLRQISETLHRTWLVMLTGIFFVMVVVVVYFMVDDWSAFWGVAS